MQATIQNTAVEIPLHSVSLTINKKNPDNIYAFHCYFCGSSVNQIKGNATRISAGLQPSEDVVVIHRCPKCSENYTFQTLKYLDSDFTILSILAKGPYTKFFCYVCRTPLLNYDQDKAELIKSHNIINFPYFFNCSNPTCQRNYELTEIVHL